MLITVIGRGHSGTRAMSRTLSEAGVFMGEPLNDSGDLVPPDLMYDACRVMAPYVRWQGGLQWDFDALHDMPIPDEFSVLIRRYLSRVMAHAGEHRGWKIPETTLVYPWIRRMFPDLVTILWVRNPRDCILGEHLTDDLRDFGIPCPETADPRERRAISWLYQYELVRSMPPSRKTIEVRFEDFVLRQDETMRCLEKTLGIPLPRIPVNPEAVDRWKKDDGRSYYPFLGTAMRRFGYEIPSVHSAARDDPKLALLVDILRDMHSVVVAYSGGADSAFLAAVAHEVLGERALAVTGVSPSLPESERMEADRLARQHGWAHRFVITREFENADFVANTPDRCYHCKSELFRQMRSIADETGFRWVVDGSNRDDDKDYRPGMRAKQACQVRSPLQEAGFCKSDVRYSAGQLGLDTADKPASACLASRMPYGTPIAVEVLKAVEKSELALRDLGFGRLRVRAHGDVARIELDAADLERALDPMMRRRMAASVRAGGFLYATLDLEGYRMGSMNEALHAELGGLAL